MPVHATGHKGWYKELVLCRYMLCITKAGIRSQSCAGTCYGSQRLVLGVGPVSIHATHH